MWATHTHIYIFTSFVSTPIDKERRSIAMTQPGKPYCTRERIENSTAEPHQNVPHTYYDRNVRTLCALVMCTYVRTYIRVRTIRFPLVTFVLRQQENGVSSCRLLLLTVYDTFYLYHIIFVQKKFSFRLFYLVLLSQLIPNNVNINFNCMKNS